MHLLDLPQSPFAFLGLQPWVIAIIVPIAGLVFVGVMGVSAMYFKNRERERWHETARVALEKGQPLPPPPAEFRPRRDDRENSAQRDARGGLVLIALGAGLWVMFGAVANHARFVGAIPGFIGIALLLYALGRALFSRKSRDSDLHPPQS